MVCLVTGVSDADYEFTNMWVVKIIDQTNGGWVIGT